MIDRHSFLQPTEFNQLDHERHFKLVFLKLFLATLSYATSALTLSHLTGEGEDTVRKRTLTFSLIQGKLPLSPCSWVWKFLKLTS